MKTRDEEAEEPTHSITTDNSHPKEFLPRKKDSNDQQKEKIAVTIMNKNKFKFENEEKINFFFNLLSDSFVNDVEQLQKNNKEGITL